MVEESPQEILARCAREAVEGRSIENTDALWEALGRIKPPPPEEIYDAPLGAAETTVEALMYCARTYGPESFMRPANVERLSRCSEAQKKSMVERLQKLGIAVPPSLAGDLLVSPGLAETIRGQS